MGKQWLYCFLKGILVYSLQLKHSTYERNMFNPSDYYQQSIQLQAQNSFQVILLKWTDAVTLVRETTKVAVVVGLVSSASSPFFDFNPAIPLTCTAVCGICWLISRSCAQNYEPQAQQMIQLFKRLTNDSDAF